jgi:hypothetical protein
MKNLKKIVLVLAITLSSVLVISSLNAQDKMKKIEKNGMIVQWHFSVDRIYFEISAPTNGWVTIGFNEHDETTNAYLLMGRVVNGKADVVEHYTKSPGNYSPITDYGIASRVLDVEGSEGKATTSISFSIPVLPGCKYHKDLSQGKELVLILAYSQQDDFQHHSIMRISTKIQF